MMRRGSIWNVKDFSSEVFHMFEFFSSVYKRWAVVGFNYEQAGIIMSEIERNSGKTVSSKTMSRYSLQTAFADGTLLRWIPASDNARGHRFGKMWCDQNIDPITRRRVMSQYFGLPSEIVWV